MKTTKPDAEFREADQLEGVPLPERQGGAIGHDGARASMLRMLAAGRLPGGLLLHGPRGIGKATLAFEIARAILVATGDEDEHRVHEQVAAGAHPNLFVLRRRPRETRGFYTDIIVEHVRKMRDDIRMTRGRRGHRVAIIDSVDDCNTSSANALLKILEEPPPDTVFLLVSHRPGQLLPTIRSRCQPVALRPISEAEVVQVLRATWTDVPEDRIDRAASLAHGRPRHGFEALGLEGEGALAALAAWLADPASAGVAVHLGLADKLPGTPEEAFGREMILDWLAGEARRAAVAGVPDRRRLASANELWEKANSWFSEADSLNLDARQTLVSVFDAIRAHAERFVPVAANEQQ